ncbi:hypothetical protein [Streptomyces acidiscabies]|uniref:Secreted protein n=1 Tax=Streptomyces acidiscabies TaxID=42234 RepID=A0AAP6BB97_9ACTN|nr:hypothetical protein [Streptomyces acidiscabies]MDX2961312.1 hypothetical protein [Streptomyces acidiscabies]MDX3022670.1 hypothetical protein [Streptomyces acidiscabies]MDX3792034.1 hypothetical protein [Streptomyces acidiscabies]
MRGPLLVVPFAVSLALAAPVFAAPVFATPLFAAPGEQPVPVLNGDFVEPAMKGDGPTTVGIDNWTGANQRYSATASGRSDGSNAVGLQKDGNTLQQRLRGVRAGARVTVSYEDSPAVSKECLPAEVADGQPYTVEASGGAVQAVTTAGDPGRVKGTPGSGRWAQRTYSFTASENEPLLTFTSKVANSKTHITCSPMVARIRAVEVPPAVDQTVDRTSLGTSEAFKGNDKEKWLHNALAACNGENACEFRPDARTSFRYYGQSRVIGEAFVNCTRNTLEHSRVLSFAERSHDSIAQTYTDAGQSLEEVARLPTSGDRTEDEKRVKSRPMATQFALAYEKAWKRPWQWFSSDQRTVVERIQPGEVSWVELQPTRERVEGWFVSKKDDYRVHAVVDGPSRAVPDRLLQRTGPMSVAEKQRCSAARPMTMTPVGAEAPAWSADKGVTGPAAPTAAGVRRIG